MLVVTEKATNAIATYVVGQDGRPGAPAIHASSGATPFGFDFAGHDILVVSEASGGASSYALGQSGSVTVRRGVIFGEPIDLASADITFTQGRMRATNLLVQAPAGEIRGEAELDLANERFSYTISSSSIDASKITLLAGLKDLLGGRIVLRSTGAGTFEQPELVLEATLEGATLRGLALPEGTAPPS